MTKTWPPGETRFRILRFEPSCLFRISNFEFRICATVVLLNLCLCGVSLAELAQRLAKAVGSQQDADSYSIQVVEPNSGTVLYSHNAHKPLMPASNMKIVTTAAALRYLGPDFEYKTRVGRQKDALVVIGNGDPDGFRSRCPGRKTQDNSRKQNLKGYEICYRESCNTSM